MFSCGTSTVTRCARNHSLDRRRRMGREVLGRGSSQQIHARCPNEHPRDGIAEVSVSHGGVIRERSFFPEQARQRPWGEPLRIGPSLPTALDYD